MITFGAWVEGLNQYKVQTYHQYNPKYKSDNTDDNSNFNQRDVKAITHPKIEEKLREILGRSNKFNFNFVFYEDGELQLAVNAKMGQGMRLGYGMTRANIWRYLEDQGIETQNHITIVKRQSTGDALTPWMILHSIGHALFDYDEATSGMIQDEINKIGGFIPAASAFMFASAKKLAALGRKVDQVGIEDYRKNNKPAINMDELINDLVAEYLWNGGKIRYNPANQNVPQAVTNITKIIDNALSSKVGKVIITR